MRVTFNTLGKGGNATEGARAGRDLFPFCNKFGRQPSRRLINAKLKWDNERGRKGGGTL